MKAYIGIDPGKDGGVAVLFENGTVDLFTIPLIGKDIDIRELFAIIQAAIVGPPGSRILIMENVHSLFGMSAKSNFTFGFVNGVMESISIISGAPFVKVSPKTWQKVAFLGVPEDKDKKSMAQQAAYRLFPGVDFRKSERAKKPHDGLIDAALMAYYGKVSNL